jgi:HTH-type transcriptional regulator, cell division transcriptional repressor
VKHQKKISGKNVTGERIRMARLDLNPPLSQTQLRQCLARKRIVLDQTAISRIENGERYVMDYELVAIAKCLQVSVAWLCGEVLQSMA